MGETRWILGDAMNRVSTRLTVLGNNDVFINVCACRDVDLSRLGKRTNPITVDLSRLGVYRIANSPELGNFFALFVKQSAI